MDRNTTSQQSNVSKKSEKKKFEGLKIPRIRFTPMKIYLYIVIVLVTVKIIFDIHGFGDFVSKAASFVVSLFSYLIIGAIIAYILNIYIGIWESKILKKMKNHRARRGLCILIAYATMILCIALLLFVLIPTLIETIKAFAGNIPKGFETIENLYIDIMKNGKFNLPENITDSISNNISNVKEYLLNVLDPKAIANAFTGVFTTTISGLFNILMGIMVSVYMLLEKDNTVIALKKINYALFSKKHADNIQWCASQSNVIFRKYFAGKLSQAVIILIASYFMFLITRVDYAILLAVIMSIMNMIPYIGPWIGGVIVVFISIPQGFVAIIASLICVLAVQALDNWFVEPKIVGGKMGVSPLLVLVGLCVFGGLFGLPGMILGDVFAAIFKVVFYDKYIKEKLEKKKKNGFLPENFVETPSVEPKEQETKEIKTKNIDADGK